MRDLEQILGNLIEAVRTEWDDMGNEPPSDAPILNDPTPEPDSEKLAKEFADRLLLHIREQVHSV